MVAADSVDLCVDYLGAHHDVPHFGLGVKAVDLADPFANLSHVDFVYGKLFGRVLHRMPVIPEERGHFIVLPLVVTVEGVIVILGASDVSAMENEHGFGQYFENQLFKVQIVVQLFFQPSPEIEQLHVAVVGLVLHFALEVELVHSVLRKL
jgi:hypothetical protein